MPVGIRKNVSLFYILIRRSIISLCMSISDSPLTYCMSNDYMNNIMLNFELEIAAVSHQLRTIIRSIRVRNTTPHCAKRHKLFSADIKHRPHKFFFHHDFWLTESWRLSSFSIRWKFLRKKNSDHLGRDCRASLRHFRWVWLLSSCEQCWLDKTSASSKHVKPLAICCK